MTKAYMHKGQLLYAACSARSSVNFAARRWGKSYIVAHRIKENVAEMPGSTGVYYASTFRQAHSRTLPSALMALEDFGIYRDVHYVIGHAPDKRLGFKKPLFLPHDLKDVVWFANGTIMIIVSQEVVLSANSLTIHWMVADEAKGLDYDKLANEVLPAIGGSRRYFGDPSKYPHLFGVHYFSDMPCGKEGSWLFKYEKEYDKELCDLIIGMEARRQELMKREPNASNTRELAYINRRINVLRHNAFYYSERSIEDNVAVVGLDYVKRCQRDLTPLVFRTSILCKRIDKVEGMFYQNFDYRINTYIANDNTKLNDYRKQDYDCSMDTDLRRDKPIAISFDYNAQITWLVASQIQGSIHKTVKSFYTKYNRRLRVCISQFVRYYDKHLDKTVVYYYDATAKATNYVETGHSAYDIVMEEFRLAGWYVKPVFLGTPMDHQKKHLIINNAFQGKERLTAMINRDNNPELIQAIQLAQIRITEAGFKKDKRQEKSLETDSSLPYELRTDATDAYDTNLLGCITMPYDGDNYMWA